MSLDALQQVIDASFRVASPLMRELFAQRLDAAAVRDLINERISATIATVRKDGTPHAALTLIVCSDGGELYFAVNEKSVLYRNLQRSLRIALTVDAPDHGLMAQGVAELAGAARELRSTLLPELDRATKRGRWLPQDWEGLVYRARLSRLFAQ
jgi:pyridoxine/pyridoxamine 5'-phosphate oxidase